MITESERVTATVRGLTALVKYVTDPIAKAELECLIEDWTVKALMLDQREKISSLES